MQRGDWKYRLFLALVGVLVVSIALGGTALAKKKKVEGVGWLGVYIQDIDEDAMEARDLDTEDGVIINDVVEDSPAEEAGLKQGDVIVKFNDKAATSANRLTRIIRKLKPDTEIKVEIIRDGENQKLTVVLGEREDNWVSWGDDDATWHFDAPRIPIPVPIPIPRIKPLKPNVYSFYGGGVHGWIGVQLRDLNEQLGEYFGVADGEGALIEQVIEDSPAEKAGLKAGDVIVEINGEAVTDVDDVVDEIADLDEGDTAEIAVLRQGDKKNFAVEVEESEGIDHQWTSILKYERDAPRLLEFHEDDLDDLEEVREELREIQEELRDAMKELEEELREALEEAHEEIQEALEELREGG